MFLYVNINVFIYMLFYDHHNDSKTTSKKEQKQSSSGCTNYSTLHLFMRLTDSLMHIMNLNKQHNVNLLIQWCIFFVAFERMLAIKSCTV